MEIYKSISSNMLISSQNFPLINYFQFRHHMMSLLEPEQKTSEYITKLWNELILEAKSVAMMSCDSSASTP